jgi:hypothetical protein
VAWRLLAAALLLAGVFDQARFPLDHDAGWFLYCGSQILHGARLYQDLVDPNPPLIFLLHVPAAAAASVSRISGPGIFKAYVTFFILLSLALCARSLHYAVRPAFPARACLLLALTALFLPAAKLHFGQREHFALLMAMPYILSAAAWVSGRPPAPAFSILTGILAGVGLAIKPYFLAAWILMELYLAWARGKESLWKRKENWTIAMVQAAYLAYLLLAAPDYYRRIVPISIQVYGAFNAPLASFLLHPATVFCAAAVLASGLCPGSMELREVRRVMAVACSAFLAGAIAQQKGWHYHFYPAVALAAALLLCIVLDLVTSIQPLHRPFWRAFLFAGIALVFWLVRKDRTPADPLIRPLSGIINQRARGEPVVIFNTAVYPAFPVMNYASARWSSRFPCLWMLPGLYWNAAVPQRSPSQMGPIEKYEFEAIVSDFLKDPPRLVMIHCNTRSPGRRSGFDLIQYLSQDPRFAAVWRDYRHWQDIACLRIFERAGHPGR